MGNHDQEESGSIHVHLPTSSNTRNQIVIAMESIEACIIKATAMGNQADILFFTHRNTGPSARTIKAAWDMIIAAAAIILEKGGGSYGGHWQLRPL